MIEVASKCGIPATMYQSLERDERKPSLAETKKLAVVFKVKEEEIKSILDAASKQNKTALKDSLASKIIFLREQKELTQSRLAEMARVTPAAMSQIESGDRIPSTPVLKNLAHALSVSIDYLLGESDNPQSLNSSVYDKELQTAFRMAGELSPNDRTQLVKFIEFLKTKSTTSE